MKLLVLIVTAKIITKRLINTLFCISEERTAAKNTISVNQILVSMVKVSMIKTAKIDSIVIVQKVTMASNVKTRLMNVCLNHVKMEDSAKIL